ncbi:hypothetical protein CONCODRAFT_12846 [Conidiobolus coronatus NRRL 28638]|uniref:Transcription factor domain-containing protein n=1 Tax=Conidiobolus coronatus (strain ATCC 28846 / CBS 209.66 / NRRL 28638) TaxID=796925 RepID=A0A137NRZ1_CONC2|nr:hypothetical protein CONCODRAFT_12846 [Conidiobolus coronatus NRRL 28638]|eukprot:KXN65539.1 hypothetical protein CONCODRAFT_12846 [Conidiobolus coronatus NRRL 28638]
MKISKQSSTFASALDITKQYIAYNSNKSNLNDTCSLSLIQYSHKCNNIHSYEWSNFQKIEQIGDFIINSGQFTILEFIFRWGEDLQSIPRIQSIICEHKSQFKESYNNTKSKDDFVLAGPILLILQDNFWAGLMESYFKYFHPTYMLFSLVDFDPKTASESLLSAIYFAGYIIQPNHSKEVFSYMKTYAICNIKRIQFTVNLSSAQALAIYCFAFALNGDASLSRVCLSHFGRICDALGISSNRKNTSNLAQYNRKLLYNYKKIYYNWTKLEPSKHDLLFEEDGADLNIYEFKYQLPNFDLNFGNISYERTLYPIFSCQFAKLVILVIEIYTKLGSYDSIKNRKEIDSLNTKTIETYKFAKITLESLLIRIPECKNEISKYLELLKIPYITCKLCINSKILETSYNTYTSVIQNIIDISIELLELFSSCPNLLNKWRWVPDIISFYLIQIYLRCDEMQRKNVAFMLKSLLNLYYIHDFNYNSMNFLILKSQLNKL